MNEKILKMFGSDPIVWVPMWGISKLRKRGGAFAGEIPGKALWFDQWYERAMSRENAANLAELGVNLVVLPFSLGASSEAEQTERDDFERMAGFLREFKIKALPYLQYQNFLQEENIPDGTVWAVNLDGTRGEYCYWRRTVCQSSKGFLDYFKSTIADALARGADGIWIDNNYLRPCRCELCVEAFRDFLTANRNDLLESLFLRDFSNVEPPPSLDSVYCNDPIVQAFADFNCERNMIIHHELKSCMESIASDAIFASNPALYRGNSYAARGIDFHALFKLNDMMYLENKFFPEEKENQISGNYHGFIMGDSLGTPAIPGAWRKADFDSTSGRRSSGLPETASEVERAILEGVVFGGASGAFWAVRNVPPSKCDTAEDQLKMYYEIAEIHHPMSETIKYIKTLPLFGKRRNLAEIAVLHHQGSMSHDFVVHHAAAHGAEELLLSAGMPFNVLHSFDLCDRINEFRLLVLPAVRLLSDSEVGILTSFVESGGSLLVLGCECGLFDLDRSSRLDSPLKEMTGVGCFDKLEKPLLNCFGDGKVVVIPDNGTSGIKFVNLMSADPDANKVPDWLVEPAEITNAIVDLLGDSKLLTLTSRAKVAVTVAEIDEDRIAIQLFSYADDLEPENLELRVNLDRSFSNAILYQIGCDPLDIVCEPGASIVIPAFKRHAAVILK